MKKHLLFIVSLVIFSLTIDAQTQTVGLFQYDNGVYDGYVLLDPVFCPSQTCEGTYLIDNCGEVVHEWPTTIQAGQTAYLLPNGNLLRTKQVIHPFINDGGRGGAVELWDWDGNLLWDYQLSDSLNTQHHDVLALPNGNILALMWSNKDSLTSYNNGRDPDSLTATGINSERIIEIQPIFPDSGIIVWEWDSWDHIVQNKYPSLANYDTAIHPELFDVNYLGLSTPGVPDWFHSNAIDYNESLDQIVMSSRNFSEIYIIDHSTTTAEAASHTGGNSGKGGDVLYRWGNPAAYGKGTGSNRTLYAQHNIHWINDSLNDGGKLMVFNNGFQRTTNPNDYYSSVDILDPQPDQFGNYSLNGNGVFGPDTAEWSYSAPNPTDFYAEFISGAERLPNGNTIICNGTWGEIFEINSNKEVLWRYVSPLTLGGTLSQGDTIPPFFSGTQNWVFRAPKYGLDFPAFVGKTLTSTGPLELNPTPSICNTATSISENILENDFEVYPNPTSGTLNIKTNIKSSYKIELFNIVGEKLFEKLSISSISTVNFSDLDKGIYFIKIKSSDFEQVRKIIHQ